MGENRTAQITAPPQGAVLRARDVDPCRTASRALCLTDVGLIEFLQTTGADQYGSRPSVPLSPMARELTNSRGGGDRIGAPCPNVAPIRGTADRTRLSRISDHKFFLNSAIFTGLSKLPRPLQRSSRPPLPRPFHARNWCLTLLINKREPGLLCVGTELQRTNYYLKLPSPLDW